MTDVHSPAPEELMAYLDGELPAAEARAILAHLAVCEHCRRLADDLREVSRGIRSWQVEEAPASLRLPDTARSAPGPMRSRLWSVARSRTFAAAAALILIAGALALDSAVRRQQTVARSRAETASPEALAFSAPSAESRQPLGATARQVAGPLIVRTVTLRIAASDFDAVRTAIDRTLRDTGGFLGQLGASDAGDAPRSIRGTLRVPAARLDEAIAALKRLGRVVNESQQSEDVTGQVVDLDARIASARITEGRLAALLQNRTGSVSDVLEVEREMSRVRAELERLDAERKNAMHRVAYATVHVEVLEERRANVSLGPVPITKRLRDAMSDGLESALSSLAETTLFLLRVGPAVVLWTALIGAAAWRVVRRRRSLPMSSE